MWYRRSRALVIMGLVGLLTACATTMSAVPPGPMAWREGYADGCNRGYVAAGHPYYRYAKDVERGQIDALYAEGWRDGFQVCKSRYDAIGQTRV